MLAVIATVAAQGGHVEGECPPGAALGAEEAVGMQGVLHGSLGPDDLHFAGCKARRNCHREASGEPPPPVTREPCLPAVNLPHQRFSARLPPLRVHCSWARSSCLSTSARATLARCAPLPALSSHRNRPGPGLFVCAVVEGAVPEAVLQRRIATSPYGSGRVPPGWQWSNGRLAG
jgi:hypothetical protein